MKYLKSITTPLMMPLCDLWPGYQSLATVKLDPGVRNHLTACLSGGLWSRGFVQGIMKSWAQVTLPGKGDLGKS